MFDWLKKPKRDKGQGGGDTVKDSRHYDMFTGLKNGLMLEEDFQKLTEKNGHVFIKIQLSDFYQVNDLFGLALGGDLIKRISPLVERFAKAHGGDAYRPALNRFIMIAFCEDRKTFLEEFGNLLTEMENTTVEDQQVKYLYHYTFLYALYFMTEKDETLDDVHRLTKLTDSAIDSLPLKMGRQGKILDDQTTPNWERRVELAKEIKPAWESRQFIPYFQVIYDMQTHLPVGAEILTRWEHPEKGIVLPEDFIYAMEQQGLIMDLDLYMLEEACRYIQKWIEEGLVTVPIGVNISKLNLYREGFVDRVKALAEKYDVPPILIELEIIENTASLEHSPIAADAWKELSDYGFTLALDSVGKRTESSVNMLKDLPVSWLKMEASLFTESEWFPRSRCFAHHLLDMAHEMEIKVIAHGIETEDEARTCTEMGCDMAQGFFFSKPIPREEFEKQIF